MNEPNDGPTTLQQFPVAEAFVPSVPPPPLDDDAIPSTLPAEQLEAAALPVRAQSSTLEE